MAASVGDGTGKVTCPRESDHGDVRWSIASDAALLSRRATLTTGQPEIAWWYPVGHRSDAFQNMA